MASSAHFPVLTIGGSSNGSFARSAAAAPAHRCGAKKKGKERVNELGFRNEVITGFSLLEIEG
jgi:hypothetical protein